MSATRRHRVNKRHSAKAFCRDCERTKSLNVAGPPMRGGYRL